MKHSDVVVIGAGPGGSSIATLLAKKGYKVTVLERAKFPREHVGESLLPFTYNLLEDLGVLEEMKKRFTRKPGVTFSNIDGSQQSHWCFDKVIDGPEALSFHVRRAFFDDLLMKNSVRCGAEVIEEARVTSIDLEGGFVHYIHKEQGEQTVSARFIVDASGTAALIARQKNAQRPYKRLHVRQAISAHWQNVQYNQSLSQKNIEIVHLGGEKLGWIWLIPLEDRLSIGAALQMNYVRSQRREFEKSGVKNWAQALYLQELGSSPEVRKIIMGGEQINEVQMNGDFSYYSDEKFGANFAVIGDAGAFLDPIFSSGIYLAMKGSFEIVAGIEHALEKGETSLLKEAYGNLEGGYKVIEELICTFYNEEALNFEELNDKESFSFEQFESAYSILHLILAGDFFSQSEKYLGAIRRLKENNNLAKYMAYTGHKSPRNLTAICELPLADQ